MEIIKCKICGGILNIQSDNTVVECEYCGNKQMITLTNAEQEKRDSSREKNLLKIERAFQKIDDFQYEDATKILEEVLGESPKEAKAFWGLCICDLNDIAEKEEEEKVEITTKNIESFSTCLLEKNRNFQSAMKYAEGEFKSELKSYAKKVKKNIIERYDLEAIYSEAEQEIIQSQKDTDYELLQGDLEYIFERVGDWKKTREYINYCQKKIREEDEESNNIYQRQLKKNTYIKKRVCFDGEKIAALTEKGTVLTAGEFSDVAKKAISMWRDIVEIVMDQQLVALNSDGEVFSSRTGNKPIFGELRCTAVDTNGRFVIGLNEEKKVMLAAESCAKILPWENIKQIVCGKTYIFALDEEGKVHTFSDKHNKKMLFWPPMSYIASDGEELFGISTKGRVFNTKDLPTEHFEDIIKIHVTKKDVLGLNSSGSVISTNCTSRRRITFGGAEAVSYEMGSGYIDFAGNGDYRVALTEDGKMEVERMTEYQGYPYLETVDKYNKWDDIIAVYYREGTIVALKNDGTFMTTDSSLWLSKWKIFEDIRTVQENEKEKREEFSNTEIQQYINAMVEEIEEEICQLDNLADLYRKGKKSKRECKYIVKAYQERFDQVIQIVEEMEKSQEECVIVVRTKTDRLAQSYETLKNLVNGIQQTEKKPEEKMCKKCLKRNKQTAKFCRFCGNRF